MSTIQVLNSKNEPVNNGDFKIIGDHDREAMTTLDTKKLTDGVYTVSWETQSLDDGHIARGSYVFGVGNVGPGAAASIVTWKNVTTSTSNPISNFYFRWGYKVAYDSLASCNCRWRYFLIYSYGRILVVKWEEDELFAMDLNYHNANIQWLRRFFIILIACSVAILAAGSSLLFLQITELSLHNNFSSYWSVFVSQILRSIRIRMDTEKYHVYNSNCLCSWLLLYHQKEYAEVDNWEC